MKKQSIFGAIAAIAVTASAAYAIVTYNPATGGWAGKGDVQTAFGWNNKVMQNNHQAITFEYDATVGYSFECEWYTGPDHNRTYHLQEKTVTFGVAGTIADTDRKTGQWTGWFLGAIVGDVGEATEPVDSDCGAEGNGMKSIVEGSVQPLSSGGGLFAVFTGDRRQIQ